MPIVDHPVYNQALGSGTDDWRQRISPGRLESSEDDNCLQKRRFAQRILPNDTGNLRMKIQIEAAETAKVSYGKIAQHEIRTTNGRGNRNQESNRRLTQICVHLRLDLFLFSSRQFVSIRG
jgi:hypothetical protein